jgi:hypothetical protein
MTSAFISEVIGYLIRQCGLIPAFSLTWRKTPLFKLSSQNKYSLTANVVYVLFGNHSSQLPHLIEKLPQWLSGPSPVLPAAGSPPDTKPGQTVFGRAAVFIQLLA